MDLCDPDELATLAKAGDLAAIDRMTRCFGDRLMRVARRSCRSEVEAEDAVQDALLSAATHLDQFRGDGRIDSWLSRMVVTACGRLRRGQKNDAGLHSTEVELLAEGSPELEAARIELAGKLVEAMSALDARDRSLIILADVEGWKANEVAERVGMTHGAVRTRLSRARRRLREELSAAGV